ncbi:hypothetical protein [Dubosiella newyorkensis]|uniref:hypothetical protein n=1 Tax=Dubosiella newyorkensis TaxID=1862672 RepID=UPI003F680102
MEIKLENLNENFSLRAKKGQSEVVAVSMIFNYYDPDGMLSALLGLRAVEKARRSI